jgi:hypothetical protein
MRLRPPSSCCRRCRACSLPLKNEGEPRRSCPRNRGRAAPRISGSASAARVPAYPRSPAADCRAGRATDQSAAAAACCADSQTRSPATGSPCERPFEILETRGDRVDRVDRHRYRSWSLDPSVRASHPRPRSISSSVPCLSFTLRQVDQARRPLHGRERPPGGHGPG